jgi:putative ABC transport system permease protein
MWKISMKGMWAHKRRLVRTCSAVLLGVASLAGTLVLGDTMRSGFAQAFSDAYAGTDVVVQGADTVGSEETEQRRMVPEELLDQVRALDDVGTAVGTIEGFAQVTGADGEPIGGDGPPTLGEAWIDDPANPYQVVEGRAPESSGEVVVDRGTATTGGLSVGDTTTVRTPTTVDATIVGIVAFGEQDSIGGAGYTGFTEADARTHLLGGASGYSTLVMTAADGVTAEAVQADVAALLPDGLEALTGTEASARAEESIGEDFLNVFEMVLLIFTGIALLVAAFSIYNTFSVILAQRTRESALFRAIGATRSQVLTSIGIEAVVVGLIASFGGVLAGLGLAVGLTAAMRSIGVDLPGGIEVAPASVAVSVAVGLVVTLLASLAPAIRASGVAPLAALRDASVDRSDASWLRTASGILITGVGVGLVLFASLGTPSAALGVVGIGAVLVVLGVVVLGPVVARPVARVLGIPLTLRRGGSGELARGNAMRNPRRTAGTASALMIGVAVVALFTVMGSSLSSSVRESVVGTIDADLLVVDEGFSGGGMDPALATTLTDLEEVEVAVGLGYGAALFDGEEQEFTVTDPEPFAGSLDIDVTAGSLGSLTPTQIGISASTAQDNGWALDDTVDVTFVDGAALSMQVGAIYEQEQLAGGIVMPRETWVQHSTRNLDNVNAITLADGVALGDGTAAVRSVTEQFAAPDPQTLDEYADDVAGQINQFLGIIYVLLALSIVIALMGIANTLALSIHERTRELGLLRAIGQTRPQLRRMVRGESMIIAVFGTVGGIAVGCFLAWGLVAALGATDAELASFSAPVTQLLVITVVGALAGVLAGIRPARRAARLDVLDAISTE